MADTNHHDSAAIPTAADGISYKGLAWALTILAIVTLVCYGIIVAFFKYEQSRAAAADVEANRSPLAAAPAQPRIVDGRVDSGTAAGPVPPLLVSEPINLAIFRAHEDQMLTTYGWVDQNAGVVRLPIARAKALLLERGLPSREAQR